jgi:chloramphenicol 3-O phosphotransferase
MKPGMVLFLNGASSSGKTSLLHALQETLDTPFLEAGIDKFIWMLPKRYLDRPLWDDVLGKADQGGETGHRLVAGMHRAIAALSDAELNVLADHVLVEPAWVRDCALMFAERPAYLVGLRCPLEVLEAREQGRKDRTLGQARLQVEKVHAHVVYDFDVDTALHSPKECAEQIRDWLAGEPEPMALRRLVEMVA